MNSSTIKDVRIRKIFDSRGRPTVEVDIVTSEGFGRASAPSGASVGAHEAKALPAPVDLLVTQAKERIVKKLWGLEASEQAAIDHLLREIDGRGDFSNIGGSVAIAISMAAAKAAADSHNTPLFKYLAKTDEFRMPFPVGKCIGGGSHAGKGAPDIQEFLAIPTAAHSFSEAVAMNSEMHAAVRKLVEKKDRRFTGGRDDEGGWCPAMDSDDALAIMEKAMTSTGFKGRIGLDLAASSMLKGNKYVYATAGKKLDAGKQLDYVARLVKDYKLSYVEDPFHEEDFESHAELMKRVRHCIVVGDDLFATDKERLERGARMGSCNALIIKPNQAGTLSDVYATVEAARKSAYTPVVSHRSGETCDDTISHLAVGLGMPFIKTGITGGERLAKLNELIRIENTIESPKMAEIHDLK
jgi:enolase